MANFLDKEFKTKNFSPGKIIHIKRSAWGITQQELAKQTGISEERIIAYENDQMELDEESAKKIANAVGVHPHTLYGSNN